MKTINFLISLITVCFLLLACSSKPVEKYYDYFYSYMSEDKKDSFTYILYLGEKGEYRPLAEDEHSSRIPQRQLEQKKQSRKADDDDFISLSFRMEEEAFERLEKILANKKLCKDDVEYDLNKYSWLRYTIKGHCITK